MCKEKMIKKFINDKVIKTATASTMAYYFTDYFHIKYGLTACMIAVLSLQEKKTESLKITLKRVIAVILGMAIFITLTYLFGIRYLTFALFILIFMPLCIKLDLLTGFMISVVISTHILSEKTVEPNFLLNEFYLLILGLVIGNLLNLYIPKNNDKINDIKQKVNILVKDVLLDMAGALKNGSVSINQQKNFKEFKKLLIEGKELAVIDFENTLFDKCNRDLNFFGLRKIQYVILKRMRMNFKRIHITHEYSIVIANFIEKVADELDINSDKKGLLLELEKLKWMFSKISLPKTREEFENRAILYLIIDEMHEFLSLEIENDEITTC